MIEKFNRAVQAARTPDQLDDVRIAFVKAFPERNWHAFLGRAVYGERKDK